MPRDLSDDKRVSFGSNDMGAQEAFVQKKRYYEDIFTEDLIDNSFSFWGDFRLYGRVNRTGEAIIPKESSLDALAFTKDNEAVFTLNFVADAFADLVTKMTECIQEQRAFPSGPYSNVVAHKGWSNVNRMYDNYIKKFVYTPFVEIYMDDKRNQKKCVNYKGFLEVFGSFVKQSSVIVPTTRTGFIESSYCTPYISGLVIDLAKADYSEDFLKTNNFISDRNFLFFADLAKQYGFMIDRNAPWRLICNLNSRATKRYAMARGYDPGEEDFVDFIHDNLYVKSNQLDMVIHSVYLKDMYDSYVERNPLHFDIRIPSSRTCSIVDVVTARQEIPDGIMDLSVGEYRYKWSIRSYYYLRMFERNSYFDSTARMPRYVTYNEIPMAVHSKNLRFLYDVFMAAGGSREQTRASAYIQTIETLEKEILGIGLG